MTTIKILFVLGVLFIIGCVPVSLCNNPEGCGPNADFTPDKVIDVKAFSFGYEPESINIEKGEKIRLIVENTESRLHTFTSPELGIGNIIPHPKGWGF